MFGYKKEKRESRTKKAPEVQSQKTIVDKQREPNLSADMNDSSTIIEGTVLNSGSHLHETFTVSPDHTPQHADIVNDGRRMLNEKDSQTVNIGASALQHSFPHTECNVEGFEEGFKQQIKIGRHECNPGTDGTVANKSAVFGPAVGFKSSTSIPDRKYHLSGDQGPKVSAESVCVLVSMHVPCKQKYVYFYQLSIIE